MGARVLVGLVGRCGEEHAREVSREHVLGGHFLVWTFAKVPYPVLFLSDVYNPQLVREPFASLIHYRPEEMKGR
jgi:hypothetical protein